MPLKLINAPATFERHMNSYIHDILDKFMIVYLDERLIYSGNKAENEVHLFWVFDYLHEETLFIKFKKYEFGKDSVKYLGHIVEQGHMRICPSKVQAITKWLESIYIKHIQ